MKNKIYIAIVFASFFMVSCLKDEGNYDYEQHAYIDEVTGIEEAYSIYKFDEELVIDPELKAGGEDFNETDYEYKWYLIDVSKVSDRHEWRKDTFYIAETKKLEFVADATIPYKKMKCVFEVTSNKTEIVFKESTILTVKNNYNYGSFILHQKGENSELSLIKENGEVVNDIYGIVTGGKILAGNPEMMCHFYPNKEERLNIYTDQYPDYGAIFDFKTFKYLYPASECFFGDIPEKVDFSMMEPLGNNFHSIVNGRYFTMNLMMGDEYRPKFDYNLPDFDEDVDYVGQAGLDIVHGAKTGKLYSPGYWGIKAEFLEGASQLLMPGKMLYLMKEPGSYWMTGNARFYVHDGPDIVEYKCLYNFNGVKYKIIYELAAKNNFSAPELIDSKTMFVASETEKYLFFTKDNIVYRHNYDNTESRPIKFYEFPLGTKISYFTNGYYDEGERLEIGIYDESGLDNNASLFYLDRTGKVIESYENICGKIVGLVHKSSI